MTFYVVEKKNPLAVHAHCSSKEGAENWIKEKAPLYVSRGYFIDKTLTADSFMVSPFKS